MRAIGMRLGAVLLGLAAGLVVVTPAQAVEIECYDNHVCMWESNYFLDDRWVDYTDGDLANNRMDIGGWDGDNELNSVKNGTWKYLVLFDNDDYTGTRVCVKPRSQRTSLDSFNDRAESLQLFSSAPSGLTCTGVAVQI
jgi:hypothetical protein